MPRIRAARPVSVSVSRPGLVTRLLFSSRVNTFPAPIIPHSEDRKNLNVPLNRVHLSFFIVHGCPRLLSSALRFFLPSVPRLCVCSISPRRLGGCHPSFLISLSLSLSLFFPVSRFNQRSFLFLAGWNRFQPAHSTSRQASNRAASHFEREDFPQLRLFHRLNRRFILSFLVLLLLSSCSFSFLATAKRENERRKDEDSIVFLSFPPISVSVSSLSSTSRETMLLCRPSPTSRGTRVKRFRLVILRRFSLPGKTVVLQGGTQTISRFVHFRPFLRSRVICETRVGFPVCRGE